MAEWRHSGLTRCFVIVLLVWTCLDLTVARLCALDQFRDSRSRHPALTHQSSDTARSASVGEDCFCCSHSVVPAGALWIAPLNLLTRELLFVAHDQPSSLSSSLYHPPRPSR